MNYNKEIKSLVLAIQNDISIDTNAVKRILSSVVDGIVNQQPLEVFASEMPKHNETADCIVLAHTYFMNGQKAEALKLVASAFALDDATELMVAMASLNEDAFDGLNDMGSDGEDSPFEIEADEHDPNEDDDENDDEDTSDEITAMVNEIVADIENDDEPEENDDEDGENTDDDDNEPESGEDEEDDADTDEDPNEDDENDDEDTHDVDANELALNKQLNKIKDRKVLAAVNKITNDGTKESYQRALKVTSAYIEANDL